MSALIPVLFFSFSRNILRAYILPSLPGIAVCISLLFHHSKNDFQVLFWDKIYSIFFSIILICILVFIFTYGSIPQNISLYGGIFFFVCIIFSWKKLDTSPDITQKISLISLKTIFFYTGSLLLLGETISDRSSTFNLNNSLITATKNDNLEINFPFGIPYSFPLYYPYEVESNLFDISNFSSRGIHDEYVIVNKKDHKKLVQTFKNNDMSDFLIPLYTIGSWEIYKRDWTFPKSE